MERRAAWVLGIVFGGLFLALFGFLLLLFIVVNSGGKRGLSSGGAAVGVVEILGEISDAKKTLEQLEEMADADRIKAVVLRVDSPGGTVGPSQELYDAVRALKKKKKVVASMGSVAASGGYYIACGADRIFANPGTLTGSIGVLLQMPNVDGLLKWAGVQMRVLTSGKMKDAGSPFREMSVEEQALFTEVLRDLHGQFVEAVAEGRGLPVPEVEVLADGRIYTGRQALERKLVDELGGLQAAVRAAAELGGIKGDPKLVYPTSKKRLLEELMGEDFGATLRAVLANLGGTGHPAAKYHMAGPSGR
jgi:protease IV